LKNIVKDVEQKARLVKNKTFDKGQIIGDSIRKHMKEVNPKVNVWEIMDKYSAGRRTEIEEALSNKFDQVQKIGQSRGFNLGR